MPKLEKELDQLKDSVIEMMDLVTIQLVKSKEALLNMDTDLAQEIMNNENRINAMELSIDRDCENFFALLYPVAVDLRFILSILKINGDLERMGDHAEAMANIVLESKLAFQDELLKEIRFDEMFDTAMDMLDNVTEGFVEENSKIVRQVFKKDKILNKINANSTKVIRDYIKKEPDAIESALDLYSVIRKLERVGDLSKNVAEDIIFYIDAKVLKHKKSIKILKKEAKAGKSED